MSDNDLHVIMNASIQAQHDLYLSRFSSCDRERHWHDAMHRLLIITEQCRQAQKRLDAPKGDRHE